MNKLSRSFLKQLDQAVDDVRDLLQRHRDKLKTQQKAFEDRTNQFWSAAKEVEILKESLRDYERLQNENRYHQELRQELRDRLQRLRDDAKALTDEFRQ